MSTVKDFMTGLNKWGYKEGPGQLYAPGLLLFVMADWLCC
jgi:hypothetical protein